MFHNNLKVMLHAFSNILHVQKFIYIIFSDPSHPPLPPPPPHPFLLTPVCDEFCKDHLPLLKIFAVNTWHSHWFKRHILMFKINYLTTTQRFKGGSSAPSHITFFCLCIFVWPKYCTYFHQSSPAKRLWSAQLLNNPVIEVAMRNRLDSFHREYLVPEYFLMRLPRELEIFKISDI